MTKKKVTDCVIVRGEIATMIETIATVEVIAPSEKEACEFAEETLKPYYSGYPQRIGFTIVEIVTSRPITKVLSLNVIKR